MHIQDPQACDPRCLLLTESVSLNVRCPTRRLHAYLCVRAPSECLIGVLPTSPAVNSHLCMEVQNSLSWQLRLSKHAQQAHTCFPVHGHY